MSSAEGAVSIKAWGSALGNDLDPGQALKARFSMYDSPHPGKLESRLQRSTLGANPNLGRYPRLELIRAFGAKYIPSWNPVLR